MTDAYVTESHYSLCDRKSVGKEASLGEVKGLVQRLTK